MSGGLPSILIAAIRWRTGTDMDKQRMRWISAACLMYIVVVVGSTLLLNGCTEKDKIGAQALRDALYVGQVRTGSHNTADVYAFCFRNQLHHQFTLGNSTWGERAAADNGNPIKCDSRTTLPDDKDGNVQQQMTPDGEKAAV